MSPSPPSPPAPPRDDMEFRWLGRLEFASALELQQSLVDQRRAGTVGDVVLLLEHPPIYTIGRTRDKSSLAGSATALPHPVVEIGRGGQATFHGPGQLVGYPVLDLERRGRDLHRYLRALEQGLIDLCADLGVAAQRRDHLTGVWVGPRKLASIGVGVRHWVSMHGFALNVTDECLAGFGAIVPCGISGVEMTCLATESGLDLSVERVAAAVRQPLARALSALH